jgi:predicted ATP-grasp superfamily ATP-dependent carboligase
VLVHGIEPNMRWRGFCSELVTCFSGLGIELVVLLGALLADSPHTRPVPVAAAASDPALAADLRAEPVDYKGPTGIVGVLQHACVDAGIPAVSLWASVPHYVAQPPCPKATLALIRGVEDVLDVSLPLADLPQEARAWERGVDELAEQDTEVADYVRTLEEAKDATDLPEASGDAIAREFERYLRRRRDPGDRGGR